MAAIVYTTNDTRAAQGSLNASSIRKAVSRKAVLAESPSTFSSCELMYAFFGCGVQDLSSKVSKFVDEMGGIEAVMKDPKKMQDVLQKLDVGHQLTLTAVRNPRIIRPHHIYRGVKDLKSDIELTLCVA